MSFRTMLLLSLTIGTINAVTCWIALAATADIGTTLILVTTSFFIPWAAVQALGLWKYRWRGLWLLLGLPPMLLFPSLLFWVEWSCEHGNPNACI